MKLLDIPLHQHQKLVEDTLAAIESQIARGGVRVAVSNDNPGYRILTITCGGVQVEASERQNGGIRWVRIYGPSEEVSEFRPTLGNPSPYVIRVGSICDRVAEAKQAADLAVLSNAIAALRGHPSNL